MFQAEHELGIDINRYLFVEDIHFLTRLIYSASNEPGDNVWCEREIDYLLVSVLPSSLSFNYSYMAPNADEVAATAWLDLVSLESLVEKNALCYTPWFRKIVRSGHLRKMWQWADAKVFSSLSQSFQAMDEMWDRSSIVELK